MRIIFALIVILFAGCASTNLTHIPTQKILTGVDFTKYSDKDFLITIEEYYNDYESIGTFNYKVRSGAELKGQIVKNGIVKPSWIIEKPDEYALIDSIYNLAIKMQGDAISRFKITQSYKPFVVNNTVLHLPEYQISGFIIKRK